MILDEKFKKMVCDLLGTETVPQCVIEMIAFTQAGNRRVGGQYGLSNDQVVTILLIAKNRLDEARDEPENQKPEKKAGKKLMPLKEAKQVADVLGIDYDDDVDQKTLNEMIEKKG